MKKTLVALAVTAFATSASALTIYEADGSKVTFDGSIRMLLDQSQTKEDGQTADKSHTNLSDAGSRFGVKMNHMLSDDLSAFGGVEFRLNGDGKGTDKFGDVYTKRAYVGLNSQTFGKVSFGRQLTIGDEIHQAGFDYAYGVLGPEVTDEGNAVVRYDYEGFDGLKLGVGYRFAEERNSESNIDDGKVKHGYDAGAIYSLNEDVTLAAGYSRNNYKTTGSVKHHKDAWGFGALYDVDSLGLGLDYMGSVDKNGATKTTVNGLRLGVAYSVTPEVGVYGNYGYAVAKVSGSSVKTKTHELMLGSDYRLHDNVITFVEGKISNEKTGDSKTKDYMVGVGLRVFW